MDFNSIKVRLERNIKCIIISLTKLFQFHKGTIRTMHLNTQLKCILLFQFHKGTIRTQISNSLPVTLVISIP